MRWKFFTIVYCNMLIVSSYAANHNDKILVGTTGDYPPLTYVAKDGKYTGKDIKIITRFAKENKFVIEFVPTTWQTMSQDLSAGKFNIAVGGISENQKRKELFYLSDTIEVSSKVPLIHCSDMSRFVTFSSFDKEDIVVAENKGGTNQDFVLQNIKQATVVLYSQNYKALDSLDNGALHADVMFTDDIEAEYRHEINPRLCVADIPEKFPSSPKVYLFPKTPKGSKLNKLFNLWWHSASFD